jgi:hypothetical protein
VLTKLTDPGRGAAAVITRALSGIEHRALSALPPRQPPASTPS